MAKGKKVPTAGAGTTMRHLRAKSLTKKMARKGQVGTSAIRAVRLQPNLKMHGTRVKIDATGDEKDRSMRKVRFGAATVSDSAPDPEMLLINVKAGREALARAKEVLLRPGVTLRHAAGVPRFWVEAANPKILIRDLNGHIDRGQIVDGVFVSID